MLLGGKLQFKTTSLAPCAVICSRVALLPYASWSVRPSAGDGGDMATLTVQLSVDSAPLVIEVSAGLVSLQGPELAPLADLLGVTMQPVELLNALKEVGVFLAPTERDAAFVDVTPKDCDTERAMCNDVASLAGSHLVASSKWTQFVKVGLTTH
jgi:hypothetical protein